MLHLLKKLELYTKLGPKRVHKAPLSNQNILVIICKIPAPTKAFSQSENNTELLLHVKKQYQR